MEDRKNPILDHLCAVKVIKPSPSLKRVKPDQELERIGSITAKSDQFNKISRRRLSFVSNWELEKPS